MQLHEKECKAVYVDTLIELMGENPDIVCLEADLGSSTGSVPKVREAFPDRFINVGVAEANMIGIAAGMANDGMIPFCATFTAFATRRVYDQLSISVAYANNPVNIIGVAPGVTTTFNGATHMCFQDMAIMRAMPNMRVYAPADAYELRSVLRYMADRKQPAYMQLIREKMPKLFDETYCFDPHKARVLTSGTDVTLVTTGFTTKIVYEAIEELGAHGISAEHIHYPSVKPFDSESLIASVKKTGAVLTVENQTVIGGLGSAVCEVVSEHFPVRVKRLGIQDRFGEVGSLDYLVQTMGFGIKDIINACDELKNKN